MNKKVTRKWKREQMPLPLTSSEWGETSQKPIFSPSKHFDFGCGLRFKLRWIDKVTLRAPVKVISSLGTLVHAAEAAIDLGSLPDVAIASAIKRIASETKLPEDIPLFKQLAGEVSSIVLGVPFVDGKGTRKVAEKYSKWVERQKEVTPWETFLVEKRLFADLGPVIVAPKLDLAIELDEGIFAVERKTKSTISDDAKWANKFRLNNQILSQVLALATSFPRKKVAGAMVRAVPYSRQNSKKWTSDLPQGLSNVRRKDPIWLRRSAVTETLFLDSLVNLRREYERRVEKNSWPAEGLANGMCEFCDYQRFCRGEVPARDLVPLPTSDLELETPKPLGVGVEKKLSPKKK